MTVNYEVEVKLTGILWPRLSVKYCHTVILSKVERPFKNSFLGGK